jgi:S1-C subfamily serine protease
MSQKWVVGTALTATARAAAPGTAKAPATAAPSTGSAKRSTSTAVSPTAERAATPKVSATGTRRTATTAANRVAPDIVDILATDSTTGAAGTGIVLTSTGEVLTNYHVITGATRITATDIGTGLTYPAKVVGYDLADDVAVLQLVGASGLPTAQLATTAPSVGETVIAVGNADGAGGAPKWAAGTVSSENRSVVATNEAGKSPESLTGMLQTTTPIVPGYSGGPLVNSAGQVVGMDTSGEFTSMSKPATAAFAIPIGSALSIANQIVAGNS